jgi:drug/metabolite transporter (DMT)-like permease
MNARQRSLSLSNLGLLLVALGAATWGTDTFLRTKLLQNGNAPLAPVPLVLGEHLVLAFYAIPVVIRGWHEVRRLNLGQWGALAIIGWGGSAVATVLFSQGLAETFTLPFMQAVSAFNTVFLLQQTQPFFAVLTAAIFLRERLTARYIPIFVLAAIGAYLVAPFILLPGMSAVTPFSQVSQVPVKFALLGLGAAALWGSSTTFGRLLSDKLSFATLTGARFLMALPFLLVWALLTVPNLPRAYVNGLAQHNGLLYLVLLALLPGLIGLLLYYRGLRHTRASYATLAELAFPATGAILNAVALNKPPAPTQLVGVALVAAAVIAMNMVKSGVRVAAPSKAPAPLSGASV